MIIHYTQIKKSVKVTEKTVIVTDKLTVSRPADRVVDFSKLFLLILSKVKIDTKNGNGY